MSVDSVVAIAWDVLKSYVVVPIERGFRYVMSSKSFADRLREEVHNLEIEDRRVRDLAQVARNNIRILNDSFTEWRQNADKAMEDALNLLDDFDKASKTCCYGTLPDPYCRYRFSTKAETEIKAVHEIAQNCIRFRALDDICLIGPAPADPTPARKDGKDAMPSTSRTASFFSASTFESRDLMIRKIMEALASKSNSAVGVYGMGGLGKSTLLDEVERMLREKKSFDWVAKADVSENPNIKTIQGEIANGLGLTCIKEEETISGRAKLLRQRLEDEERQEKKVLIILDNLWKGLDLKSVGIPCGFDNKVKGCQLLLTSRDRDVLRGEMGCDEAFALCRLEEEEAKILFERIAGDKVREDDFKALVDKALAKCEGVPFLIVTMAKRFRAASLPQWKDTVKKIEEFTDKKINNLINDMLQWSYDNLEEEVKSLLRLCVVYGVSKPSLQNLVKYGFGLGIFQGVGSMEETRSRLNAHICTLQASSLLLDSEDVASFKIHDLVREFVASVASSDHLFLVLKDKDKSIKELPKDKLNSYRAICFPYVDMERLPEELDCSELQIFLLFTNNKSLHVPDSLFNSMRKLMVLNLTGTHLTRSPLPFQLLENLHTLCLDDCLLEDVAILGKLKRLWILSFVGSKIRRLPKEIEQLVELRLLDLNHCSQLEIIESGVLGNLTKLEELYMERSFENWNVAQQTSPTNASLIELNHMKNLRTLHVSVPNLSMLPEDLNLEKLTEYEIEIGNPCTWWSEYKGSRKLNLKSTDAFRKKCIQSILYKTDDLYLERLNGFEQSICTLLEKGCPRLKHLYVQDSPFIRYILKWSSFPFFKDLETLCLENLVNLEKICNKHISNMSFSTLKVVQVARCDKMEILFPLSLLRELTQLEEIIVASCKLMCGIVEVDDYGTLELSKLRVLQLHDLSNFKSFFIDGSASSSMTSDDQGTQIAFFNGRKVAFPSLEKLEISGMDSIERIMGNQVATDCFQNLKSLRVGGCNKLKCVWDKELHHQVKFQCLRFVSISECKSLTSLFPTSVARDLTQLEELEIDACGIVELIEKEEGLIPRVVLPKLTSLKLRYLTELKCTYIGVHALHWSALKTLEVHGCNKVEILASQPENKMPLHKQPLFLIEKGGLPTLQELILDLSERMEIWHGHFQNEEFFCKLRVLELRHISNDSAISACHFIERVTNLEELVVCQSYLEVPSNNEEAMEGPRHEQKVILPFSRHIQHLKTLDVSHCDGLSNIFTPTIAEYLRSLTKLKISNCRMLREVISDEAGKEGHVVAFNQLKYLELDRLMGLRCFSSGGYMLMFPLLEDVIVSGCANMKFFAEGPIEASKLERVKVSEKDWFWKENLNITVQNMFDEMGTIVGVEFMRLSEFPKLVGKWHRELSPMKSSWQLHSLVVDRCPSFVNAIPSKLMLVLDNLENLQVRDCESLEEIFDLERLEAMESTQVLSQLWKLKLVNLPKLRRLWNKDLQESLLFNSLSILILYNCSNLGHAFTPSMAGCISNLWRIEIKECGEMEGVIADENGPGSVVGEIAFPKLRIIELERLPNLTSFLLGKNYTLKCPKLEVLSITRCPKMRSLTQRSQMEIDEGTPSLFTPQVQFPLLESMALSHMDNLSKIWTDSPQENLTFDHLEKVEAQNCKSLVNLFPYWVATSLNEVEELRVESCGMEEIVAGGDDVRHTNTSQVLFPKLTSLVLHDIPQLKSFCPNLPTLNWPLMEELRVTHCNKLNKLCLATSMNNWTQRDDQRCLLDQEARSSFERGFPNLERLFLVEKDIQMIEDGKFPNDIFGKRKAVTLACFHDQKVIFPLKSFLERFQNLQSLEVFCCSFEYIFPKEELVDEGEHSVLKSLSELKLSKLHNLKCVWSEDCLVSKILESIETLEICDCPNLMTVFPTVTSFQNLIKLVVKNSSGLVHLVTVSAVMNLAHLTEMTIIGCEKMKEIVKNDENEEGKVICFGKLKWLILQQLPSLECFSSTTSCSFKFPFLAYIEVEECPKMKIFSKGTPRTPELEYASLFGYNWKRNRDGGDVNTAIRTLSA